MHADTNRALEWLDGALSQHAFPWQQNLTRSFLEGTVPRALDVPTGLGKTATMAAWLAARAAGADVPRRLVYVVDRRAVVDQATAEAERLREFVAGRADVRAGLHLEGPLPISTLRGQHADNREWLEDPSRPAIVVGTVDMIGSRVLFSGYGVSRKMRPVHAGLLGVDTLFILDEAHLVPAFERLLEGIVDVAGPGAGKRAFGWVPPAKLISLSATGREVEGATLRLSDADHVHPVVKSRLGAVKRAVIRASVDTKKLAECVADEAYALMEGRAEARRVVVFCHRRDDAEKAATYLRKRFGKVESDRVELMVGGRRVHERQDAARWLREKGFQGGSCEHSVVLVATSAGEVGVDFDATDAVMDVVSWERMVQRLGRVNRRGSCDASSVVLVPTEGQKGELEDRTEASLALLGMLPSRGGELDLSIMALADLKKRASEAPRVAELLEKATTPAPLYPPLTRSLVDAWSMTSLESHSGRPEVEPWLRGWVEEEEPEVQVIFRKHLPVERTENGHVRPFEKAIAAEMLRVAAPHLVETISVRVFRLSRG